jgi:hypothetical protein
MTAVATTDPLVVASDLARGLGHTPLRHRNDYECWICPRSGSVAGGAIVGEIFKEKCR